MSKVKLLDAKSEIKYFIKNRGKFNSVSNAFVNCHRQQWHAQLGYFIWDLYKGELPENFAVLQKYILKDIEKLGKPSVDNLCTLSISYLGCYLWGGDEYEAQPLVSCFGKPHLHNRWGEGFHCDGHQGKRCASYFFEICGIKTQLWYDSKGTVISIDAYKGEETPAEIMFYMMMELVKVIKEGKNIQNDN